MPQLLVLHHALGLTPAVRAFARTFSGAGYDVVTPDFFHGRTFTDVEEGLAYAQKIGFDQLISDAEEVAAGLEPGFVVCGFSMGAMGAMHIGVGNDAVVTVFAVSACVPPSSLQAPWPRSVALRVLAMKGDEFFMKEGDLQAAQELQAQAANARLKLLPGHEHLFIEATDPASVAATNKLIELVMRRLDTLEAALPSDTGADDLIARWDDDLL